MERVGTPEQEEVQGQAECSLAPQQKGIVGIRGYSVQGRTGRSASLGSDLGTFTWRMRMK